MQKGGGADPLSSGHSQGSGKEAQTKPSPIADTGRGGETDHGKRGTGRQQKQQRLRQAGGGHKDGAQGGQGEVPGQGTEGRLGERQAAGPGLSDQPSAMRIQQGSEQGTVESDFCSHAHCAAC